MSRLELTDNRKEATDGALMFFNSYRERSKPPGSLPLFQVLDKHNHLRYADWSLLTDMGSNILSIGTEDDAQGKALLRFVRSCVDKVAPGTPKPIERAIPVISLKGK